MKVVFFEDVEGTAQVGDVKDVKNGFARNFLLPRGLAGPTTKHNLQRATSLAQREAIRQQKLDTEARARTGNLEGYRVTIEARVGENGRLFGSVTNRDIAERLNAATTLEIDPHIVLLPEPIRELGEREVTIKFTRNVSVQVAVEVVPDEESKPIVERLEAERAAREAEEAKRAAELEYRQQQERRRRGETAGDGTEEAGEEEEPE
jgi:large subunit ribosomal protein L9